MHQGIEVPVSAGHTAGEPAGTGEERQHREKLPPWADALYRGADTGSGIQTEGCNVKGKRADEYRTAIFL
ncbi:MAG: hypothetical protein CVV34_07020 [Methanomicrobiales archaeon HGW-Methanomicrobiales-5]|nr:MAG: hypothetical protein CVV34_07020 [Methanomicrobiales archaeon HGW-Methanomicrobiales-5]